MRGPSGNPVQHSLRFIITFGLLMAIGPFSINMYLPALPLLGRELGAPPSQVQLTFAVYIFGMALGQIPYGALSDRWGRRPPMLLGLSIYTLAALSCALATSVEMLVVSRFLQALGGCAVMVIIRAIVRDLFPPLEGAKMLSTLMLVMGVAPILGPLAGSWIMLGFDSWRAIFAFLFLYGAAGVATLWLAFPETRRPGAARERSAVREPLLHQWKLLFGDRHFYGNVLAGGLSQAAMFTYLAGSPYVIIEYFGMSPQAYGWIFGLNAAGLIAASQVNRLLLPRWGVQRVLLRVGRLAALSGAAMLALALTGFGGLAGIVATMFVCVFTQGFVIPNTSAAALVNHARRAGIASGTQGTLQFTMASMPSVLLGLIHPQSAVPLAALISAATLLSLAARQYIVPAKDHTAPAPRAA